MQVRVCSKDDSIHLLLFPQDKNGETVQVVYDGKFIRVFITDPMTPTLQVDLHALFVHHRICPLGLSCPLSPRFFLILSSICSCVCVCAWPLSGTGWGPHR